MCVCSSHLLISDKFFYSLNDMYNFFECQNRAHAYFIMSARVPTRRLHLSHTTGRRVRLMAQEYLNTGKKCTKTTSTTVLHRRHTRALLAHTNPSKALTRQQSSKAQGIGLQINSSKRQKEIEFSGFCSYADGDKNSKPHRWHTPSANKIDKSSI